MDATSKGLVSRAIVMKHTSGVLLPGMRFGDHALFTHGLTAAEGRRYVLLGPARSAALSSYETSALRPRASQTCAIVAAARLRNNRDDLLALGNRTSRPNPRRHDGIQGGSQLLECRFQLEEFFPIDPGNPLQQGPR